jgi:hypothetical protein
MRYMFVIFLGLPILFLILVGHVFAAEDSTDVQTLTWNEIKTALAETICVEKSDDAEHFWISIGSRERCGFPAKNEDLDEVIQDTIKSSGSLIVSLRLSEQYALILKDTSQADLNRTARQLSMKDENLLRVVLPRIKRELKKKKLSCNDCPFIKPMALRRLSWQEFVKYLNAYIWPDPVEDKLDENGNPTGKYIYGYHICLGLNGISSLNNPDPQLIRAGFVLVMDTLIVHEKAGEVLHNLKDYFPQLNELDSCEAKTGFLRQHFPSAVSNDVLVQKGICETLNRYSTDLGLEIEECSALANSDVE